MANVLEIIIKVNGGKAAASLRAFDKELNKFGASAGKGFDNLKKNWSAFDKALSSPAGQVTAPDANPCPR